GASTSNPAREPEAGPDLDRDGGAGLRARQQPAVDLVERHLDHRDVLRRHAAAGADLLEAGGTEESEHLARHSRPRRARDEALHRAGGVAGLLEQLAAGRALELLGLVPRLVAGDPG